MSRPLDGCRIVDFGIITAGAATSALLADLGAEVIKVESPTYRDPFRAWSATDMSLLGGAAAPPFFRSNNRGKRGISIDLKQPAGREALLRLIAKSDVVLDNFRRGVLDRLGLDAATLRSANPAIILLSISSQGGDGPDARQASFGSTLEAVGGLAWITGYPDGPPVVSGRELNFPDQVVALFAAGTVLAAWLAREPTQKVTDGTSIDVVQRELTSFLMGERFLAPHADAGTARLGNASPDHAVQDCFRAADDRWVAVSVDTEQLETLAACIGGAPTPAALANWVVEETAQERADRLIEIGIAACVVQRGQDLPGSVPWSHAITRAPDGALIKAMPFELDSVPFEMPRDAPAVGQDTAAVLRDIAGYGDAEIAALVAAGAIECAGG
jgi:crotonobetainyl-CoA:carnitine CoA-transferase CaiB-like acyl-CoA transferase